MALMTLKMPDGSEKQDYYSTLDDLFTKLRRIEEDLDKVDEKTKQKVESEHNKFLFRFMTNPQDGVSRNQLQLHVEVVPI